MTSFSALNSTKQIVTAYIRYTSQLSRVRSKQTADDLREGRISSYSALSQSALRVLKAGLCELQVSLTTQPSRGTPSHPYPPAHTPNLWRQRQLGFDTLPTIGNTQKQFPSISFCKHHAALPALVK